MLNEKNIDIYFTYAIKKTWLSTSLKLNVLNRQNQGTIFLDTRLRGYDESQFFNYK